jgi:hypothetical protein
MKTIARVVVLSILMTPFAAGQETPKLKIAVVRIQSVIGEGNLYERVRLASCDKDALAAIKKLTAEMKSLQKKVVDVEDEMELADLGKRVQLLNQKINVLRQNPGGNFNPDMQAIVRKFVVDNFKDKYSIIMQQDSGYSDRVFLWKGGVETDDITDEVGRKFRAYLDKQLAE